MRFWMTPSYTSGPADGPAAAGRVILRPAEAGQPGEPRQARLSCAADTRGERPHLLLLQVADGAVGITNRGEHQVGQGLRRLLRIIRIDRPAGDPEGHQLALPVDDRRDQPAACGSLDLSVG